MGKENNYNYEKECEMFIKQLEKDEIQIKKLKESNIDYELEIIKLKNKNKKLKKKIKKLKKLLGD